MSESGKSTPRPSQVTLAGWVAVSASIFLIIALFESVSGLQTLEVREGVEEFLAEPPGSGLGLDVSGALRVMRIAMLVAGACAAATAVLGVFVLRRDRTARVVLSVLAAVLFVTAPLAGGFLAMMVAVAAVLLWSRPANDWFAGRPPRSDTAAAAPASSKSSSKRKGAVMTENPPGSGQDPAPERPAPYVPGAESGATPPPVDDLSSTGWSDQAPTEPWGGAGEAQPSRPTQPTYPAQGQAEKGYAPQGGPVWAGGPMERPGTVTAAAWITWVSSGLTALLMALLTTMFLAASDEILDQMRNEPGFADIERQLDTMGVAPEQLVNGMWVFGLVGLLWSLAAFVLAIFAFRRRNWARIALVVSASVTALFSLVTIFSGISVVPLLAAGATIVLLFVGGANDWYAGRTGGASSYPDRPHPPQPPPGGPTGPW